MRRLFIFAICIIAANSALLPAQEKGTDQKENTWPSTGIGTTPPIPPAGAVDTIIQNMPSQIRGRAVVLDINARIVEQNQEVVWDEAHIVEQNQEVVWDEAHSKTAFPGTPVGIRLVGANVVVVAQFTPYIRRNQKYLVAQAQIWMEIPGKGIRYFTSMQTIPLEYGEPVYFFPLGAAGESDSSSIEVMLTMHPYEEN